MQRSRDQGAGRAGGLERQEISSVADPACGIDFTLARDRPDCGEPRV
jgi:hypothetical protein